MISIGPYKLDSRVVLAPMAGITDRPFRTLCRHSGAAMATSEMLTSNIELWNSEKSTLRRDFNGEIGPRTVQIAGSDPQLMATAAGLLEQDGIEIIDINMGCPAKKVLKRAAGSALMKYPELVREILTSVIAAVNVPVTLKMRTGWDPENRNGVDIAKLAEDCGVRALTVHGRTRQCAFKGQVEYDTIATIKEAISIPLLANGDIDSPQKAKKVIEHTNADAVMIGRAAQGMPWIFTQCNSFLESGKYSNSPGIEQRQQIIISHMRSIAEFYGETKGVFICRKHVASYLKSLLKDLSFSIRHKAEHEHLSTMVASFKTRFNMLNSTVSQQETVCEFLNSLTQFSITIAEELAA